MIPQNLVQQWTHPSWDLSWAHNQVNYLLAVLSKAGYYACETDCNYGLYHRDRPSVGVGDIDVISYKAGVERRLILCQVLEGEGPAFGGTFNVYPDQTEFVEEVLRILDEKLAPSGD